MKLVVLFAQCEVGVLIVDWNPLTLIAFINTLAY